MNEQELVHKIRQVLDLGANDIDRATIDRLRDARVKALNRQRISVGGLSLAGLGRFASENLPAYARTLVAAFMLLMGVVFTYLWNNFEQAAANEEIDSALLSDDLPPAAYLDKGFQVWLDRSSRSPQ